MRRSLGLASILLLALPLLAVACNGGEEEPSPTLAATATASPAATARPVPTAGDSTATLTWFGHSMFLLTSPGGTTILMDPNSGIGYDQPELPAVTVVTMNVNGGVDSRSTSSVTMVLLKERRPSLSLGGALKERRIGVLPRRAGDTWLANDVSSSTTQRFPASGSPAADLTTMDGVEIQATPAVSV